MIDLRLPLMCGTDIPIVECQLVIHQPKIREIALIGEKEFFLGAQCLCVNKSMFTQDETLLKDTNNFQIFMTIMREKEAAEKKAATMQLFSIMFPEYKISFTPRSILFNKNGEVAMVDDKTFGALQEMASSILCINSNTGPMAQQGFNPADAKAREIAEKLMRGRQRVAAQKGEGNPSVLTQYLSILTIGLNSMSLEDLMELTVFQLYDLIERYTLYVNWDMDIRSRLAGGKPDSKPDNWMKSIH